MTSTEYKLDGHKVVPCDDLIEWAKWYGKADRKVAGDKVGDVSVSTVFLGLDHNFTDFGDPILFETMVFGGAHDQYCERYSTWDEAEKGHRKMVELAQGNSVPDALETANASS